MIKPMNDIKEARVIANYLVQASDPHVRELARLVIEIDDYLKNNGHNPYDLEP